MTLAGYPLGVGLLLAISVLIYLGLGQRVLDRMRLSDRAALAILAAMILGSFIRLPVSTAPVNVSVNLGGAVIPAGLAVYLLVTAGTAREKRRTVVGVIMTAVAVFATNRYLMGGDPWQTGTDVVDPIYVFPLLAGIVGYLGGRSRRGAFVAATLGVILLDVIDYTLLAAAGTAGAVAIGGAGVFDVVVLAGIVAVLLAEVIGETRERLQGGPSAHRPPELLRGLKSPAKPLPAEMEPEDEGHWDEERR